MTIVDVQFKKIIFDSSRYHWILPLSYGLAAAARQCYVKFVMNDPILGLDVKTDVI
jgi:hypothetical protein